jgi:hypothetical protein
MRSSADLRDYQRKAIDALVLNRRKLLVARMGAGKTATTLFAIRSDPGRVLIVAPLRVAKEVWRQEAQEWEETRHLTFSLIAGTAAQRRKAAAAQADVYLVNWENLHELVDHPWDWLVCDESSRLRAGVKWTKGGKKPRADGTFTPKRLTAYGAARTIAAKAKRVTLLTGTPRPNGIRNMYGQVSLLDPSKSLGTSMTNFTERFFHQAHYSQHVYIPNKGAEEAITALCAPFTHVVENAFLPDQIVNDVWVTLPPEAMQRYQEMKEEFSTMDITAANAAVMLGKLLQITSGNIYDEEKNAQWVHDEKLEALGEILDSGDNVLCWYPYKHGARAIADRFGGVDLRRAGAIPSWNKGEIPLLVGHPASGGHGLNLQYGGHVMVWYGLLYDLELYEQACARLARPGQKNQVVIHRILARGTVDEKVSAALAQKGRGQLNTIELLKEALSAR